MAAAVLQVSQQAHRAAVAILHLEILLATHPSLTPINDCRTLRNGLPQNCKKNGNLESSRLYIKQAPSFRVVYFGFHSLIQFRKNYFLFLAFFKSNPWINCLLEKR
jgi:hypothetical protein